jgi:hypothetical protein|tara:strand:+ start:352 stop:693 length:342 start_codon:yes stop_codon:yes gene_type:complete
MRKIKLTESQLARIIDKVLKEDESEETPLDKVRGKEFTGVGKSMNMNAANSMARMKALQEIMKAMGVSNFQFTYKNLEEVYEKGKKQQEVLTRKERKAGKQASYIVTRVFKVI